MIDFFKGAFLKVLAFGGLLLAGFAVYQKKRADRAEKKADTLRHKANEADARYQAHVHLQEARESIRAAQKIQRADERRQLRKGKRDFMNNNWSWLLVVLLLAGCKKIIYVPAPLPECPSRPVLPAISAEELQCLSDETAWKLWERQTARREYAEELEAYCVRPEGSE